MKYSVKIYAQALAEAAQGQLSPEKEHAIAKRFFALLKKNGDLAHAHKIIENAGTLLAEQEDRRRITVETARAANVVALSKEIAKPGDIIEHKINPEIVAGVRVTVNDELQFDGTLRRKLNELFRP